MLFNPALGIARTVNHTEIFNDKKLAMKIERPVSQPAYLY